MKFGLGRASHDAAQEVQNKDLTRSVGITLVHKFDGEWPTRFENDLFEYLSIDKRFLKHLREKFKESEMNKGRFLEIANSFRSNPLWKFDGNAWNLKFRVCE